MMGQAAQNAAQALRRETDRAAPWGPAGGSGYAPAADSSAAPDIGKAERYLTVPDRTIASGTSLLGTADTSAVLRVSMLA